jgi:hypothetical protein
MAYRNALWVLVTVVVSFWVGVIFARMFPDGGANVQWGSAAEWAAASAAAATAFIAWRALGSWQQQLKGATTHAVAHEIATAAVALRIAFYNARSPFIFSYEYPPDYLGRPSGQTLSSEQKATDYAFSCTSRLKELRPYLFGLVQLRPKAGASLGDNVVDAIEALARKARELEVFMQHEVDMRRAGQLNAQLSDYDRRTRDALTTTDKSDGFSLDFEGLLAALTKVLKPYMG